MIIDVHVIVRKDENPTKLSKCLDSLVGEPINLHICDFIPKVGNARISALLKCKSDWVSWVDPDDYILPNAFSKCLETIKNNPHITAVYTNHWSLSKKVSKKWFNVISTETEKLWQLQQMHHIVVYKKSVIEAEYPYMQDVVTKDKKLFNLAALRSGTVKGIDEPLYMWNSEGGNHEKYNGKQNPLRWHERVNEYYKSLRQIRNYH